MRSLITVISQALLLGFAAAAQPGPFQTYVLAQTVRNGWRRSAPLALAPLISDGPIVVLAVLVLSRVPDSFTRGLSLAGGAFVLLLAVRAGRRWLRDAHTEAAGAPPESRATSLLNAAVMNVLNPGPYLFWSLVSGPILVAAWRTAPSCGIAFLAGFYGAMVATLTALIVVFGAARRFGPRLSHALLGFAALALAGFGIYHVLSGIAG